MWRGVTAERGTILNDSSLCEAYGIVMATPAQTAADGGGYLSSADNLWGKDFEVFKNLDVMRNAKKVTQESMLFEKWPRDLRWWVRQTCQRWRKASMLNCGTKC